MLTTSLAFPDRTGRNVATVNSLTFQFGRENKKKKKQVVL